MKNTKPFPLSLDQARAVFDYLTDGIMPSSIDLIASIANHYNELHDEYRDIDWCWIYDVEERDDLRAYYYYPALDPVYRREPKANIEYKKLWED